MSAPPPVALVTHRAPSVRHAAAVILEVSCPYCTRPHFHEGRALDTDHGHHLPPCRTWRPEAAAGYLVREAGPTGTGDLLDLLGDL